MAVTRAHTPNFTRISNHPERDPSMALVALRRGRPLGRPLTLLERIALAVASAAPTHHLVISTTDASRESLARAFTLWVRRLERYKARSYKNLIYIGTAAQGLGDGGYHLHLLLWNYLHAPVLHGQAKALNLGRSHITKVKADPMNVLTTVSYVLGQQEEVFGSRKHRLNQPREKGKRHYFHPHLKTLQKHRPELFVALKVAKDKSIPDERFFLLLPSFIKKLYI
ncbi:MAG: hypothetical protein ACTHM1_04055 [Solirubrobacteraceae bacterium]